MKQKKKLTKKEMQNRQIMWAVILMISLILIVVAVPLIKKNFIDKFRYINLDFQKTRIQQALFFILRGFLLQIILGILLGHIL